MKKAKASAETINRELVHRWRTELEAARKREEKYRKDGERILGLYDGTTSESVPFNILFSNTETLLPAVYSATPRPVVQRRFKDDDPLGKAAATAATRLLTFLLDTNLEGTQSFDDVMTLAVVIALLPGRGHARVKYDAEFSEPRDGSAVTTEDQEEESAAPPMTSEFVYAESCQWNRVLYGEATRWAKVPWIAYEEYLDKPECLRLFGAKKTAELTFTTAEEETERKRKPDEEGERKTCRIYQIWDKEGGRVIRYVADQALDDFLLVQDDPLQLAGFFNCPCPLTFITKPHSLIPTAPYTQYESQAKELNELTRRIKMVTRAIKAKGIYDGSLGTDIKKLLEADDNELVPAESASSLAAEKGLQNAIWFMPLEQLIVVLTQLYQAREACKQTIYEITGISDILRGATQASETATAQTIKNQWGTLRLKRSQKEAARFARDLLRLQLELAASKFSEETWARCTGLPYLHAAQVVQLQQALQSAMLQQNPQAIQQIQAQLQTPQWGQVLALLRDDFARAYRVDVETNSTVEPEATEDQKQISELFTAIGQFLNGVGPLVAKGVMPFEVAQTMLLTITRRFRFGTEIEDQIKQMQPPQPEDGGEQGAAQQKALQDQQKLMQQQLQMQQQQQELDLKAKTMEAEKALLEKKIDLELREIQLQAEQDKFQMEKQSATQMLTLKAQSDQQKVQTEQKVATLQNTKFKTENVVNQKADAALGKSVQELKGMVQALVQAIGQQAQQQEATVSALVQAMTAPRTKTAIRGKDGRIESMEERVA